MKCDMTRQTDVALQNNGYVSDVGPHMKVSWVGFERNWMTLHLSVLCLFFCIYTAVRVCK